LFSEEEVAAERRKRAPSTPAKKALKKVKLPTTPTRAESTGTHGMSTRSSSMKKRPAPESETETEEEGEKLERHQPPSKSPSKRLAKRQKPDQGSRS
jgi:hypothetical protein